MRISVILLLLLLAFAAYVADAQIATQTCAVTNGVKPCICNDVGLSSPGCACRYPGANCPTGGTATTCRGQCGNGAVNENAPGTTYRINRNTTLCTGTSGCDAFITGETTYHTCTETCDTGLNVGKFIGGTCCTRECNSTRTTDEFHYWDIAPRKCREGFPSDCIQDPNYSISCAGAAGGHWCRYLPLNIPVINSGVRPALTSYCPKFPCFDTTPGFGFCQFSTVVDNIEALVNNSATNANWYGTEAYRGSCYQASSPCYGKPHCVGSVLTAPILTDSTLSFTPRSPVPIVTCGSLVSIESVASIVTPFPSNLRYTWTLVSHSCPGTITQVGDNLQFSGSTGTPGCSMNLTALTECGVVFTPLLMNIQLDCCGSGNIVFGAYTPFPICADVPTVVPMQSIGNATFVGPPSASITYQYSSSNCTGISIILQQLRFPTTPRTCTVNFRAVASCGRVASITRVFTTHTCCKNGIDESAQGEQCDFGSNLTGYIVNDTCCTDACKDGPASGDNVITGRYCTVDADCARPLAIPPVTGICATVGSLKYCKYQATTYARTGVACSTPCPHGQCYAPTSCSSSGGTSTCFYGTSNNLATLDDTECRDDTQCKHTYTCDLTTFATLFLVPSATATFQTTTAPRRCDSPVLGINPGLTWSNVSPLFGTPVHNLTFGLVGTCALTVGFINGPPAGGRGVTFSSPWIPGGSSVCNISVLISHACGSFTVFRNVPVTCCGDGILQSGNGETCDAGVLTNSNDPGSCCSLSCASTLPTMSSNPLTVPQICSETNQPNISLVDFFNLTVTAGYSITSYAIISTSGCYAPFNLDLVNGIFRFYQIAQTCNLTLRATSNCGTTIDVTRSIAVTDCCGNSVTDYSAGETCENPEEIGYVSNGTCCTLGCKANGTDPTEIMYPQQCAVPGDCSEVPIGMGPFDVSCPNGWCVFKPSAYQPSGGGCTYYSDCPVVSCWDRACNASGFCNYGSSYADNLFVVELYKCYTGDVCQGDTYCTVDGALAYNDVTFSLPVVGSQPTRLTTFPTVIDLVPVVAVTTVNENSFGGPPAYVYTVVATNVCGFPNDIVSGEAPTLTFTGQYSGSGALSCTFNITVQSPCDGSTASRIYTFSTSSCGDGTIQGGQGETCDIGALNGDPSECCSSSCLLTTGAICGPSSDSCMNDAVCHSGSGFCPSNPFTTAGTPCFTAPAGSQCSTNRTCSGVSYSCPNPYFPDNTPCHNNSNWCTEDICNGISSECFIGDEIVYDDGLFCNGNETCNTTTGLEIPGTPVNCDDGDSCFIDACDEGLNACTHTPVPNSVGPCGASNVGACEFGNYSCDGTGPSPNITCVGAIEPDTEVCFPPGVDENCNGLIDEICTEQVCIDDSECQNITVAACQNVTCNTTINQCYVTSFPTGTPCDDNVNCTENDECKLDFSCAGDPIVCSNGGNPCLLAFCEETTGECEEDVSFYEGNSCVCASNTCTVNCQCDNNATCNGGSPKTCSPTGNPCTSNQCDTVDDLCHVTNNTNACNDGLACTTGDTCNGGGVCVGTPTDCTTPEPCLADTCEEPFGTCSSTLIPGNCFINGTCYVDGETSPSNPCRICNATHDPTTWTFTSQDDVPCDDDDPCTVDDVCHPGLEHCLGGPKNCTGVPIDPQCQAMECDPVNGTCYVANLDGAPCDTGVPRGPCALGSTDICGGGSCARVFAIGLVCHASLDPQCDTVGICGAADACPPTGSPDGTPCADSLYCFDSTCQNKMCEANIPRDCAAFNTECANYTCDEGNDVCALVPVNEGLNCDIGNNGTCFEESLCDDMGQCVPVPFPDTTPCPPPDPCIIDTFCTGVDTTCTTGSFLDCSHLTTGCGVGVCNSTGSCVFQPFANGTTCDGDANLCTIHDACWSGVCVAGPEQDCSYLNNPCDVGTCIALSGTAGACLAFPTGNCGDDECFGGCTFVPGYWQSHHGETTDGTRRIAWPQRAQMNGLCGKTWLEWMRTPLKNYSWRRLFVHWVSAKLNTMIGACVPFSANASISAGLDLLSQCDLDVRYTSPNAFQYLTLINELDAYNTGVYGPGQCTDSLEFDCGGQTNIQCSPSIHRQVMHASRGKVMNAKGKFVDSPFDASYPFLSVISAMVREEDCVNGQWDPYSSRCSCDYGWTSNNCASCAVPSDPNFVFMCIPTITQTSPYLLKAIGKADVTTYLSKKAPIFTHVNLPAVYPGTNGYDCNCRKNARAAKDTNDYQMNMLELYQENYEECETMLEVHAVSRSPLALMPPARRTSAVATTVATTTTPAPTTTTTTTTESETTTTNESETPPMFTPDLSVNEVKVVQKDEETRGLPPPAVDNTGVGVFIAFGVAMGVALIIVIGLGISKGFSTKPATPIQSKLGSRSRAPGGLWMRSRSPIHAD